MPFPTPSAQLSESAWCLEERTCLASIYVPKVALLWVSGCARAPSSFRFIFCLMPTTPRAPTAQMQGCLGTRSWSCWSLD